MARVLVRSLPPPTNGHAKPRVFTDEELRRRFGRMLDRLYDYADECDSPMRPLVRDYQKYLRSLSIQDIDLE